VWKSIKKNLELSGVGLNLSKIASVCVSSSRCCTMTEPFLVVRYSVQVKDAIGWIVPSNALVSFLGLKWLNKTNIDGFFEVDLLLNSIRYPCWALKTVADIFVIGKFECCILIKDEYLSNALVFWGEDGRFLIFLSCIRRRRNACLNI